MKKVGILTFYLNHNYGSTLQCYALKKVIENITDYEVQVIPHTFVKQIDNGFGEKHLYDKYNKRIAMFDDFLKNEIGCTEQHIEVLNEENAPICDYYVVGSDVVWDTYLTGSDKAFFLNFAQNLDCVKIAYAPSLNGRSEDKLNTELFKEYIDKFDYLSIREERDIQYLNKFTKKEIKKVVDPTLLLDRYVYDKLLDKKRKKEKNYILVYLIYDNTENIQMILNYVNRVALEKDMEVVHFIYNIPNYVFGKRGKSFAFDGPKDFLWYVKNADLIITNSFHGTAFSIIFEKPFYSLIRRDSKVKTAALLHDLNLEDRIWKPQIQTEVINFEINYSEVNKRLEKLKQESYNYLKKALL